MSTRGAATVLLVMMMAGWAGAAERGPVARWDFDEGQGDTVRDTSGHANRGTVHGASWVKLPQGSALAFDGIDDYVNCGRGPSLDLTGAVSLEAWINPRGKPSDEAGILGKFFDSYLLTYYGDNNCWWYIAAGSNHCKAPLAANTWHHVAATFDGKTLALYVDGRVANRGDSKFPGPGRGKDFLIGRAIADPQARDPSYPKLSFFKGMVDAVGVYDRALTEKEIGEHFRAEAAAHGIDTRWFQRLKLTSYLYPDRGQAVVECDFAGLLSLPREARIEVQLSSTGEAGKERTVEKRIEKQEVAIPAGGDAVEVAFSLAGLEPGSYRIEAGFTTAGICPMEHAEFTWPVPEPSVPPPAKRVVAPLPPEPAPPAFGVEVSPGGGFLIRLGGESYPVETWISYPRGEFNWLAAARPPLHRQEASWKVTIGPAGQNTFEVVAGGRFYSLKRRLVVRRDHVDVEDTYTNNTDEDLGLLIYNHLHALGKKLRTRYTAGYESAGRKEEAACPSVFAGKPGAGIGLLPLDDVSIVQAVCYSEPDRVGVGTERFALGPHQSYTTAWAVYVNGSGDFYDFINAVRRGEDRIGTIDGGLAFLSKGPFRRRNVPTREYLDLTRAKYGVIHCLSGVADDPQLSVEGIEFVNYPREKALLRKQMDAIHGRYPGLKVIVHVAHSLYLTNNPDCFPHSKVIRADGSQAVWSDPDGRYISRQRQQQGWRWWIYYPTPGNRFHDALLKSVDVMLDEIGADGFFMDGFLWGYRGSWTYDRWDGHSAEVDRQTHTIKRKMGSVLLLSQPSLIQFARKVRDKGGVIVANNSILTRSLCREKYIIHDREVHSGPFLQLAPSCAGLANPSAIKREKDLYRDAIDKLRWGMLLFYYEEGELTYPTLPARSFPITFEEIRSGMVKGPERIVTMLPGPQGWRGQPNLHLVHRYDARGGRAAYDVLTTSGPRGVRSDLQLRRNESAVVEKLPLVLESERAVNLVTRRYDRDAIKLILNGQGPATLKIKTGTFAVRPGAAYQVRGAAGAGVRADAAGVLSVPLALDGQVEVEIRKAK